MINKIKIWWFMRKLKKWCDEHSWLTDLIDFQRVMMQAVLSRQKNHGNFIEGGMIYFSPNRGEIVKPPENFLIVEQLEQLKKDTRRINYKN